MMEFPKEEIMKQMAAIAFEQATEMFAAYADKYATELPDDISGKEALTAFAAAIRSTNEKQYPKGRAS
jgi:hypothetical protein